MPNSVEEFGSSFAVEACCLEFCIERHLVVILPKGNSIPSFGGVVED